MEKISIASSDALAICLEFLAAGKTLIVPTDTSYGISGDATSPVIVRQIFELKGRDFSKPVGIFVADLAMAKQFTQIGQEAEQLFNQYLPGPLTLVLPKKANLPEEVGMGSTLSVRMPDQPFLLDLIKFLGRPLVNTSANLSGQTDLYDPSKCQIEADLLVDGGVLLGSKPSTVYDVANHKVLRQGEITVKQ